MSVRCISCVPPVLVKSSISILCSRGREWSTVSGQNPLASLPAVQADTLIIGQATQGSLNRSDQPHAFLGIDVVAAKPPTTGATANHGVLVARDMAAAGFALWRQKYGCGRVR